MPKLSRKNKKLVFSSIFFLVSIFGLFVANFLVQRQTRFDSQASETLTPLIIPGSLLDTDIDAFAFEDVDQNDWAFKYIQQISPIGIIPPKTPTQFDPKGLVPRKDMAVFMLKTYETITGESAPLVDTPFTDIADLPQETQDAIAKIYGLKITAGTTDTTFSPDQEVDRAQMVTFFMNMYRALTGDYPPESDVPFTDLEDDPNYQWSIKYIKRAYNHKITAGLTETTFGQAVKTTREQMATFIFNFMRLFGSSWNNPVFKNELADIKSIMFNREHTSRIYHELYQFDIRLEKTLPYIKQTGYNTVRIYTPWKGLDHSPLREPPSYTFETTLNSLKILKQNQMKAIINLNSLGEGWSPNDIDHCSWTTDLNQYLAFEEFVKDFLTAIQDYADMTYLYISTEGSSPCSLDYQIDGKQIASILRPTIGSLPQRLPKELRNKFKIGYHDFMLLTFNYSKGESPVQMPFSYDYYSNALNNQEEKNQSEIIAAINQPINNVQKIYPFTPLFYGEFGTTYCNYKPLPASDTITSTNQNQARVLKTAISHLTSQNIGFNIWQWQGQHTSTGDCPYTGANIPHPESFGQAYFDLNTDIQTTLVSKPAHIEITNMLSPSSPEPECPEYPVYGQKRIDQHNQDCRLFYSHCLPKGFTMYEDINSCSELCTGEPTWVRYPDGFCANKQYPNDCVHGYDIDPTCDPDSPDYNPNIYSGKQPNSQNAIFSSPSPTPVSSNIPVAPTQTQTVQAPTPPPQSLPDSSPDLFPTITHEAQQTSSTPQSTAETPTSIPSVDATEATETGVVGFMDKAIEFVLDLFTP